MKTEKVLFPYVFSKLQIYVTEDHFYYVHMIRLWKPPKIGSLKLDRANRPLELLTQIVVVGCNMRFVLQSLPKTNGPIAANQTKGPNAVQQRS